MMLTQFIAFSGGVDSTALALSMPDAIPLFTDTGWEFKELYAHLERFEQVTGREVVRVKPNGTLPEYIDSHKFFPNHGARYCTRLFKIDPMNRFLRSHLPAELCIGLRADEPDRVGNLTELEGLTVRYPLRERGITRLDCVQLCAEAGLLPRNPPYMARGGCKGCFYKRKNEVLALRVLAPDEFAELMALEQSVQDERGTFFHMFPNVGMSLGDLAKQEPLFDLTATYQDAQNTSDVGGACGLFCNR